MGCFGDALKFSAADGDGVGPCCSAGRPRRLCHIARYPLLVYKDSVLQPAQLRAAMSHIDSFSHLFLHLILNRPLSHADESVRTALSSSLSRCGVDPMMSYMHKADRAFGVRLSLFDLARWSVGERRPLAQTINENM
jgi:hypothetical protein